MTIRTPHIVLSGLFAYLFIEVMARPKVELVEVKHVKAIELDPNIIQEMRKFKLEVLKTKILNEINLPEPPVIQTPAYVPRNMLKMLKKDFEDVNAPIDDEELIIYPINDDFECIETNETACSRFDFELPQDNKTTPSMHIWFHKVTPREPLFVTVGFCSSVEDRMCDNHEVLSESREEFGWTIIDIPARLVLNFLSDNRFCTVEAHGSNIGIQGESKPFVVVNMNSATSERKRRSTRTMPGKVCTNECCKIDFYISFKEIGWHFVVAPAGFHANMCYGKCNTDQLNAFPSHYHRTMNLALANKTTPGEKKEHAWTPCCSPTNLKPLSMIYKAANDTNTNSTHTLIHHEIRDMIVESCGCW